MCIVVKFGDLSLFNIVAQTHTLLVTQCFCYHFTYKFRPLMYNTLNQFSIYIHVSIKIYVHTRRGLTVVKHLVKLLRFHRE